MTPLFDHPQLLDIDKVVRSTLNPRRRFSEPALQELATNIQRHGVLQPILTRPVQVGEATHYEIVAGERRWRASRIAGMPQVPSIVREMTDTEALEIAVIENAQREDLHPLEEAEGFEALMRAYGHDQATSASAEDLAHKIGKSRTHVYNRLKLLALIPDLREAFFNDEFNATVAQQLARIPAKLQTKAIAKLRKATAEGEQINVRASAELLRREFHLRLDRATFPIHDATLVESAGACTKCPKMSGNEPDLFGDEPDNVCTDGECFTAKHLAHNEREKDKARANGLEVIDGDNARALLKFGTASDELNGDYVYMDRGMSALTGVDKSLKKLLGTLLQPSALFEHPKDKTLREIVVVVKAIDALRKHGLLINDPEADKPKPPKKAKEDLGTSVATARDTSHMEPSTPSDDDDQDTDHAADNLTAEEAWIQGEDSREEEIAHARVWRIEAVKRLHNSYQDAGYIEDATEAMRLVAADLATTYMDDADLIQLICDLWGFEFLDHLTLRQNMLRSLDEMNIDQLHMLMAELVALGDIQNKPDEWVLDVAGEVLPSLCTRQEVEWVELFRSRENPIYPTRTPSRAGEASGGASQGGDTSPPENQYQAPQGGADQEEGDQLSSFAGQRVSKDGAFWQDQFVKVKKGQRKGSVGIVWNIKGNGDLFVCFDHETYRNDIHSYSPSELTPLPNQTAPALEGEDHVH